MARPQPHSDLSRRDEAGQQTELDYWRFCRLFARAPSEPHSGHSHHATMIFAQSGAYGARTRKVPNRISRQKRPLTYGFTRVACCREIRSEERRVGKEWR